MTELVNYIIEHTERGECQCGQCCDKQPDRPAPGHSVDLVFFWVSTRNEPTAERLRWLLESQYPDVPRLSEGPSYLELGAELGDQGIAICLIGLGHLLKLWQAVTPLALGIKGEQAQQMARNGLLMCTGLQPLGTEIPVQIMGEYS